LNEIASNEPGAGTLRFGAERLSGVKAPLMAHAPSLGAAEADDIAAVALDNM
jgi:hypothetical protein